MRIITPPDQTLQREFSAAVSSTRLLRGSHCFRKMDKLDFTNALHFMMDMFSPHLLCRSNAYVGSSNISTVFKFSVWPIHVLKENILPHIQPTKIYDRHFPPPFTRRWQHFNGHVWKTWPSNEPHMRNLWYSSARLPWRASLNFRFKNKQGGFCRTVILTSQYKGRRPPRRIIFGTTPLVATDKQERN